MKNALLNQIKEEKLIVIIRGVREEQMLPLLHAMYDGGIRLAELTFDPLEETPNTLTADLVRQAKAEFGDHMHIGVGTVLTERQVKLAAAAGAEFAISPNVDTGIITQCRMHDMLSIPGALTPSEIVNAYNAGADIIKLFPSDTMGIPYIKAVRAPLRHIPMLAVGGVSVHNLAEVLATGVWGVGIGSGVVRHDLLARNDYAGITALAKQYTDIVKSLRA